MFPRPSGFVTLLTDFGTRDPYVGIMKGALLRAHPKVTVFDLGHDVPPQDVTVGAFFLAAAIDRFPAGTVHTAVVDPGVGTQRRVIAVAARETFWLAPDNGLLTEVIASDPAAEVRAVDIGNLNLAPASRTFHGRDVFAPLAAWLAGGRYGFTALGPRIADSVAMSPLFDGPPRVVHVDGYGNLITNVRAQALSVVAAVQVGGRRIAVHGTYADVAPGDLLGLVGSYGLLEVAENGGNAAATLGLQRGAPVELMLA
ncbi:MAG: SAM-dependent chlorinase/fluorinase [Planctomycetota bacterium]